MDLLGVPWVAMDSHGFPKTKSKNMESRRAFILACALPKGSIMPVKYLCLFVQSRLSAQTRLSVHGKVKV